CVRAGGDYW
nr:immunoglobulin heavy chain junction region [Mus musculus]NSM07034.1 immunoglobulin heavy chain junction region [Mus musculus]